MRRELEVRENEHAPQAMSDPVDAIAPGLALDVVEDGRHVVLDQVVDRPARLASFAQKGLAKVLVDPVASPQLGIFARAPDVEDVDLVTTAANCAGRWLSVIVQNVALSPSP